MKRMARNQQTLASQGSFEKFGRKSKRELFLEQMNLVVPWSELLALVEPIIPSRAMGGSPWVWRSCCGRIFAAVVRLF
jgi:IS5 family transposase